MPYQLVIRDNFHRHEPGHETNGGTFPTADAAVAEAKRVIEESIRHNWLPGINAARLLDRFSTFGEITSIFADGGDPAVAFDPWAYARQMAEEIARSS